VNGLFLGGDMDDKPDFVVDPSGKVRDVRYQKIPQDQNSSSRQVLNNLYYDKDMNRITEEEYEKRNENFYTGNGTG
jgi:hypothetical protein